MLCLVIFTFILSCTIQISRGIQPPQMVLAHKKRSASKLVHPIPASISTRSLVHLNALLKQKDTFSCVYRSLFHAQCLTLATREVLAKRRTFKESLETLLLDESLLNVTFNYLKEYLDQHDPTHDKTTGVCLNHLLGVCAEKIPLLHTKLLPIFLDDDQKIYALHDPTLALPSPLHYSSDFIRNYGTGLFTYDVCQKELDQSAELTHQLIQLKKPNSIAHFACMFTVEKAKKWHLFLASIITNKHGKAKLYIIDSNNHDLAENEPICILTLKLLSYVKNHNNQRRVKKIKRDSII